MSTKEKLLLGLVGFGVMGFLLCGSLLVYVLGTLNTEAQSRNRVVAQVSVREAHFDKMWKVISQGTQITKASADLQRDLVKTLVEGRSASFIKLVNEQNPSVAFSLDQFTSLRNSVEGQREGFFREQEELIDMGRENHLLFDSQPSGLVLSTFGRERVKLPPVISSSLTKEVVESGKDDNVKLEF